MSNFTTFDKKYLNLLMEPFAPGMADHITPIKFEALTPDCFLLLFRTTGKNDVYHFFVSLESDYQSNLEGARCTVEDWHGNEVIDFWPVEAKRNNTPSEDIQDYQVATSGPYFAMLAEVKKPTHKGYWADAIVILPGDNIGDKIKDQPKKVQDNIRKALEKVLQHKADPKASFLDSYQTKQQDTMKDDINQTDMAVSVYVQPDGGVELFYNYVPQTVGGKPRKSM